MLSPKDRPTSSCEGARTVAALQLEDMKHMGLPRAPGPASSGCRPWELILGVTPPRDVSETLEDALDGEPGRLVDLG